MEGILAQIVLFAGDFTPRYWADCDGRAMQPANNQALFSVLGTVYGGDGQNTFNLPKLDAPVSGARYIICVEGIYPMRH